MTPPDLSAEQLARALDLFDELCDVAAEERAVALRDEELKVRSAVERMLLSEDSPELCVEDVEWAIAEALTSQLGSASATQVPPMEAPAGFVLHEELGRGGMGVVFRATQQEPQRSVAIKFVRHTARDEAQALADLRHPSVPVVYELGTAGTATYLAMEHIDGPDLLTWADGKDERERLEAFEALCRGVAHAHERGLLHRDLKPDNIRVDLQGPRLLDFGLAARAGEDAPPAGTLPYMADEVLAGDPASPKSDVFGLGCILVELMTGRRPTPNPSGGRQAHLTRRRVDGVEQRLEGALGSIASKALARVADRYPSAVALADDVRAVLEHRVPEAHSASLRQRLVLLCRRRPAAVLLTVMVWSALVPILAYSGWNTLTETWAAEQGRRDLRQMMLRASADDADPYALWTSFLADGDQAPDVLARAHLARAPWAPPDQRLKDLAEAFAQDVAPDVRASAAEALAAELMQRSEWHALADVLPELEDDTLRRDYERRVLVALRRWSDDALQGVPMVRELASAVRLDGVRAFRMRSFDEADGRRLWAWESDERRFSIYDDRLQLIERRPWPEAWRSTAASPFRVDIDGHQMLVLEQDRSQALWRWHEGAYRRQAEVALGAEMWSATSATIAGARRTFVGTAPGGRLLREVHAEGRTTVPHPDTDAVASDIEQIMVVDLDGDGTEEVVVHRGAWLAYDVAVLAPDGAGLRTVDRVQLGGRMSLAPLPRPDGTTWLVVVKDGSYPNPRVLGADTPAGRDVGLYLFELRDGKLLERHHHPLPSVSAYMGVHLGDFDGDGDLDLVASDSTDLWLLDLDTDGRVETRWRARGVYPLLVAQLDDDPADELLVRLPDLDHQTWALGVAGADTTLPPLQTHDAGGEVSNRRARELVSLGLGAAAGEHLVQLARARPRSRSRYMHQAALLFRRAGEPERALEALESLTHPEADDLRRELLLELHRYERLPDAPQAWRAEPVVIDLKESLPTASWDRPEAASYLAGRGLRLQAATSDGVLMRIPLEGSGDRLGLQVDAQVHLAELGGELSVGVYQGEQELLRVFMRAWGGGRSVRRAIGCTLDTTNLVRDGGYEARYRYTTDVSMKVDASGKGLLCGTGMDGRMTYQRALHAGLDGKGPLELRVTSTGFAGSPPAALIEATLTKVTLWGARPVGVDADDAMDAWVHGDPTRALKSPTASPMDRSLAMLALGQIGNAGDEFRWLDVEGRDRARILGAMRRDPHAWIGLLHDKDADSLGELYADAWGQALASAPVGEWREAAKHLYVDELPLTSAAQAEQRLSRARLMSEVGHVQRSRSMLRGLLSGPWDGVASRAALELARAEEVAGRHQAAAAACRVALERRTDPVFLDDQVRLLPELAAACRGVLNVDRSRPGGG